MKEAKCYQKISGERVKCLLCPIECVISDEDLGRCRGRKNVNGVLYAINYGRTVTLCNDPIEKKPLYHFFPGTEILSLGSNSCNLSCDFCQNHSISQSFADTYELSPQQLLTLCREKSVKAVAFTYTEPITWYEYVLDASVLLKENNIRTVMISNGYINKEPLEQLLPYIDAMNIDLKGISEAFYQKLCGASLAPVLDTINRVYTKAHLEITNLLIPGANDSEQMIESIIDFIASIDVNIPLHFSRYYPQYLRLTPPTSYQTLEYAYDKAKEKLNYVYLGNMITDDGKNSYCPDCKSLLIARNEGKVIIKGFESNHCIKCGKGIYGIFN